MEENTTEVRISGLTESNKRTPRTEPNIHKSPKRRTADDRGNRKSQRIYTVTNNRNASTAKTNTMRTYKHLMAIALIALASSAGIQTTQAQEEEQENFVWITDTNGHTWKETMAGSNTQIHFTDYPEIRPTIAQIVVPEHARIHIIDVYGCANLTNLVYRPASPKFYSGVTLYSRGTLREATHLTIRGDGQTGLRTIATQPHMQQRTRIEMRGAANIYPAWLLNLEWTTNWQAGDPPKMEIRNITTARGKEVEVIWRIGNLQLADAVNGAWKDYNGLSPYRFPLAYPKDMQFFRIKPEEKEEPDPEDNRGTPPQPEK